jgi:hypothetical protein
MFTLTARALLCDGCILDKEGFGRDINAKWEETFIAGSPLRTRTIQIRPTTNKSGTAINADGIDSSSSIIISMDVESFGPNSDNASGTASPNITDITLT